MIVLGLVNGNVPATGLSDGSQDADSDLNQRQLAEKGDVDRMLGIWLRSRSLPCPETGQHIDNCLTKQH